MLMPVAGAVRECENHGHEGVCVRCGSFICRRCRVYRAERPHCAECIAKLGTKPSGLALLALAFATLGLCTLLPGAAALGLGLYERRRVRAGEVPESGRAYADLAIGLGALEVILFFIVIALQLRG